MEVFKQTIWMTAVGMGLTFAAIGLLVIAMIILTRWARGPAVAATVEQKPSSAIPGDQERAEAEQAAAVAVALALALAARRVHPTHTWHSADSEEGINPWQAYARTHQLEQRKTHQTLRW
jgi:Na+-transporting methylmalonyl-CoA/oxaloacetate decarboxylase gamma subunit